MIDKKDIKTIDAFPAKKRGRPVSGNALSSAERKAAQRARDRAAVSLDSVSLVTTSALCEQLQSRVSSGDVDFVKAITLELIKRARVAQKEVTVTKNKVPGAKKKSAAFKRLESEPNAVTVTKKKIVTTNDSMRVQAALFKKSKQKSLL